MTKLYKLIRLSLSQLAFFILGLFFSHATFAQLSGGNYEIDRGGTASSTVYKSFSDFVSDLSTGKRSDGGTANGPGIDGPVTVTVKKGSGPYTEQMVIPSINGASATNRITIDGNGETIQFNTTSSSNSHVIQLNGADYFTIKKLVVSANGSSFGRCVHLRNEADYNILDSLHLQMPNMSSTSTNNAYVMIANSTSSPTSGLGDGGEYNYIQNCVTSASSGRGPNTGMAQYNPNSGMYVNYWINNEVKDFRTSGFYLYHTRAQELRGNNIHNTNNFISGTKYGIHTYNYNGNGHGQTIVGNKIHNLLASTRNTSTVYGIYINAYYGGGSEDLVITDNDIEIINDGTTYGIYNYAFRTSMDGVCNISRNKITIEYASTSNRVLYAINNYIYYAQNLDYWKIDYNDIYIKSHRYGYGIYNYPLYTTGTTQVSTIANNKINLETGFITYGILNYPFSNSNGSNDVFNTIRHTQPAGITPSSFSYLLYEYYNVGDIKNNIISTDWSAGTVRMGFYFYSGTPSDWDNNLWDFERANATIEWYDAGVYRRDFSDWIAGSGGSNSFIENPRFKDPANRDLTPSSFQLVNRGTPIPGITRDVYGNTRNSSNPDIGAVEFYVDVDFAGTKMVGNNECGGYQEEVTVSIRNTTTDTLSGIPVAYDVNGIGKVSEVVTARIAPGVTYDYTFSRIAEFNGTASHTVNAYLDASDDNTSNNIATHSLTTIESPFGAALVEKGTFAGYFALGGNGGTMSKPDVTVPGYEVEYEIQNPTRHGGSTYGTSTGWDLTPIYETSGGVSVTSGISFTAPGATSNGSVKFNPDKSLMDSMVFIGYRATDKTTGCDSLFGRWIFVPHIPEVDYEVTDVCDGEVLSFTNKSMLAKGLMVYDWQFNDPNNVEDFSEISDPVYRYSTFGKYTVDLTIRLFDYPKFEFKKSKEVTVFPVPAVDFKVINACEGEFVEFKNSTTSPIGGSIDYSWNFGDNQTSTMENPTHKYLKPGGYQVRLTASLNGCASSIVKNANQFARPVASFNVNGNCNLEEVQFTNESRIEIGRTGYRWDFGDGELARVANPTHAFTTPGSHTVKMVAVSEFGCEDSTTRTFNLNESPKADFTFSDPCNLSDIEFTRTGTLPAGNSIFEWDFNGQGSSTQENPKFNFSRVGVKHVSLKVSSENGCVDMITKEFVVKLQAQAEFVASDVCEGENVVFTNKSSVAAGNLDYLWRFGDGTTSNLTSPTHGFDLSTSGETESFNVTLVAIVPGGCSDSIAKVVTVNAASDAGFDAVARGRELVISNQKTTNSEFIYNWRFGDGGRSSSVTPSYWYTNVDQDEFEVCLSIINSSNCLSENCEMVTVDLLGVSDLDLLSDMVRVYPNPNNGLFTVQVKDAQNDLEIGVMNVQGELIRSVRPNDVSGTYEMDLSDVSSGVYLIQVRNGNYASVNRITIK
ncbi:MAG: PKD domain-containing protein [Flavobacteriales bacterium]|nr:PKD domain-containing protein [Flavobacteriales bacterium]